VYLTSTPPLFTDDKLLAISCMPPEKYLNFGASLGTNIFRLTVDLLEIPLLSF
jgi:hypothetical protein